MPWNPLLEGWVTFVTTKRLLRLEFYWVVPIGIASKLKNRAPRKYFARSNDTQDIVDKKELLNKALAMHVDQYVLPMTYESPIPYRERNERRHSNNAAHDIRCP